MLHACLEYKKPHTYTSKVDRSSMVVHCLRDTNLLHGISLFLIKDIAIYIYKAFTIEHLHKLHKKDLLMENLQYTRTCILIS